MVQCRVKRGPSESQEISGSHVVRLSSQVEILVHWTTPARKNDRASTTITGPGPVKVDILTPAKTQVTIEAYRALALELKSTFESR